MYLLSKLFQIPNFIFDYVHSKMEDDCLQIHFSCEARYCFNRHQYTDGANVFIIRTIRKEKSIKFKYPARRVRYYERTIEKAH